MITFNVNEKALKSLGKSRMIEGKVPEILTKKLGGAPESFGLTKPNLIGKSICHSFLEALHLSYSDHYPLIISPDMIWLLIAQGVAEHINQNAEELRHNFVAHEGKKEIIVRRDSFTKGEPNPWENVFDEFSAKIGEIIGKKKDLLVGNFSTTGLIEKAASEVVLMDSMRAYLRYRVQTLCGLPTITLEGTVEDWKSIRTRAENLSEFCPSWWIDKLLPNLDKFVEAAEGNPDIKHFDTLYKIYNGSGGIHVSGWINSFFPYISHYKGGMQKNPWFSPTNGNPDPDVGLGDFPSGLSKAPFIWEYYAQEFPMDFVAGFMGVHQEENLGLRPVIGYAVKDCAK